MKYKSPLLLLFLFVCHCSYGSQYDEGYKKGCQATLDRLKLFDPDRDIYALKSIRRIKAHVYTNSEDPILIEKLKPVQDVIKNLVEQRLKAKGIETDFDSYSFKEANLFIQLSGFTKEYEIGMVRGTFKLIQKGYFLRENEKKSHQFYQGLATTWESVEIVQLFKGSELQTLQNVYKWVNQEMDKLLSEWEKANAGMLVK